jgi:hypothetical protein
MSRKHKPRIKFLIKCPWCGKLVGISGSKNLLSHIVSKGIKCVGIGQPVNMVEEFWKNFPPDKYRKRITEGKWDGDWTKQ